MKSTTCAALAVAMLALAAPAFAQSGADHHEWDRSTFDREYGARGATWDHQWRRGDRLPDGYASDPRYVVNDFQNHHLNRPARGYHWVRYGDRYVLARDNGVIRSIITGGRY